MSFAEKVSSRRKQLGMTIVGLADKARLSQAYISQIESGARPMPSMRTIQKLAIALKVKVEYLVDDLAEEVKNVVDVPPDVADWLARQDTMPYIRLAMDLHDKKLSPEKAKQLVDFYRQIMSENE